MDNTFVEHPHMRWVGFHPLSWYIRLGQRRIYPLDLLLVVGTAWIIRWLTIYDWKSGGNDVREYAAYARQFWLQYPLHHTLPLEYPPLAQVVFSATLFPRALNATEAFTLWMAACAILGYLIVQLSATRRQALAFAGYLLLGLAPVALARFDVVPMLATLGAFLAARSRRYLLAYALLGIGILLKIYPLFLVPVIMIAQFQDAKDTKEHESHEKTRKDMEDSVWPGANPQRSMPLIGSHRVPFASFASRTFVFRPLPIWLSVICGALVCLAVVAVGFAAAWRIDPARAFTALTYATGRPTQIESTWSIVIFLARGLGQPATYLWAYGSNNWGGPLSMQLAGDAMPAMILGALLVYTLQAWKRLPMERACLGLVGILLLTNKVFSPQYLIWIVPFAALADGVDVTWVMVFGLTLFEIVFYPFSHRYNEQMVTHFLWLVTLRNAALLFATIRALTGWAPQTAHEPKREASISRSARQPQVYQLTLPTLDIAGSSGL